MLAMKLCFERVLPRHQQSPVAFSLPSLAAVGNGEAIDDCDPWAGLFDGRRRDNSSKGPYSTWRKNPPADFLQMQEAESRRAIRG
jgi:hypothetical protein